MKRILPILFLFCSFQANGQSFQDLKRLFWTQMGQTCQGNKVFEKTVADVKGEHPVQSIRYEIDCATGRVLFGQEPTELPLEDFEYLFDYDFDNPYLSPLMDTQRSETLVSAKIKAGEEDETPLQLAEFRLQDGHLVHAKAVIHKTNALYELSVSIEVFFGPDGHYQSHLIRTKSDVWMGSEVQTLIEGRLLP